MIEVEPTPINERAEYIGQLEDSLVYLNERIAELEFAQEDFGWTRLGGESQFEFSRSHLRRMIARSRLFFLQNPLIHRAVTLQSDYVFAQGVNIQASSNVVNKVVQDFLDDPQNVKELSSHKAKLLKEQTLILDGNIFFVLFTDKIDSGKVKVRSILIDEITEIITNPDDYGDVWFYKREWTPVDEYGLPQSPQVAYYPDIDYMPASGSLPSTRNDKVIYWDAPIVHVKTGALDKAKFGSPETYSALDWAKAHSKMLSDWATIIAMFARYALKITTPGGKGSVVAARNKISSTITGTNPVENNPGPVTGSIFVRQKDGADIEPIKTSGATTSARDARELRIMVAAAMGLPDPMLSGEVDVGNLATAKTLDRPTELKFRSRQKVWEEILQKILTWVIRWSIEAPNGQLRKYVSVRAGRKGVITYVPKTDPETKKPIDLHTEVVFPPILEKSIQERIDAITSAVTLNGKTFAVDSPELKKLTIRLMLQALGLSDVDELVDQIFATITDDDLKDDTDDNDGLPTGSDSDSNSEPAGQEVLV